MAPHAGGGAGHEVLLTGGTGFLGKVVLHQLVTGRGALAPERVHLLIRPLGGRSAEERFRSDVAASPCFARLPAGWEERVHVVEARLTEPGCGLSPDARRALCERVSHVLHCAASVEFELPLEEATRSNVTSALEMLELCRRFERLERFVSVSTAYVTPHPGGGTAAVEERLAPLPWPAEELYRSIREGGGDERALLAATGHPNTYTFTKCLAEHLLWQRRGDVPLALLRPSIISAAWREPFPGWIDSAAAFAAFVVMLGLGHLRAVIGDPGSRLDLVPVDAVATRLLAVAAADGPPAIRHAVAGAEHSPTVRGCGQRIVAFFRRFPLGRRPGVRYLGPAGPRFALARLWHEGLPIRLATLRTEQARRSGQRLLGHLDMLNRAFPYFTRSGFDFHSSLPLDEPGFDADAYVTTVCRGVARHLLHHDTAALPIAGRRYTRRGGDLRWVLRQPHGGPAVRAAAWMVTKVLRRIGERVSVDVDSFEAARLAAGEGAHLVLVPSHRSYLDFVLCSYLCFARPDLGIAIPRVAAAREFRRIPVVGRLLGALGAFYLDRGVGREDKELTRQVHALIREGRTLEFFIEGGRSRSRQFLQPKRGLLRCIQATGEACALLPVAFSYDRVPEEETFARELGGGQRPPMRLGALLEWTLDMLRGRVDIGRVHVACGAPVVLDLESDVHGASRQVMERLQGATAVTSYHLRVFLRRYATPGLDADWLRAALARRGVPVLDSRLRPGRNLDPRLAACVRHHLAHVFHPEARAAWGGHPTIQYHLDRNDFGGAAARPAAELEDPRMRALLRALFEPVCADYASVASAVAAGAGVDPRQLAAADPQAHLPNLIEACDDLACRGVLLPDDGSGRYAPSPRARDVASLETLYQWPEPPAGGSDPS